MMFIRMLLESAVLSKKCLTFVKVLYEECSEFNQLVT